MINKKLIKNATIFVITALCFMNSYSDIIIDDAEYGYYFTDEGRCYYDSGNYDGFAEIFDNTIYNDLRTLLQARCDAMADATHGDSFVIPVNAETLGLGHQYIDSRVRKSLFKRVLKVTYRVTALDDSGAEVITGTHVAQAHEGEFLQLSTGSSTQAIPNLTSPTSITKKFGRGLFLGIAYGVVEGEVTSPWDLTKTAIKGVILSMLAP